MKKTMLVLIFFLGSLGNLFSQTYEHDFLQVVELESYDGKLAVFSTVGTGRTRDDAETNAVHSLFYTLLFKGVYGINDGNGLVVYENKTYTNSFFNSQARYKSYCADYKRVSSEKIGQNFQVRMMVTLRLSQLIRDVEKSTAGKAIEPLKPTIMVVPFKRQPEDYRAIIENDFDISTAVTEVQKGFVDMRFKTVDFRRWTEMATESDYNSDREFLMASGADVYVIVRVKKEIGQTSRVSLILEARETATGLFWGSATGSTNYVNHSAMDLLCRNAVGDVAPEFYNQILYNYSQPINVMLDIKVHNASNLTMFDVCNNGKRIVEVVRDWLDDNAYKGDYHQQGEAAGSLIFDNVVVPRTNSKGEKISAGSFANDLRLHLINQGVDIERTGVLVNGNYISVTIGRQPGLSNVNGHARSAYLYINEDNSLTGIEQQVGKVLVNNNVNFIDEPHKADYFVELKSSFEMDDPITSGIYNVNPCYVQLTLKFYDNKTQKLLLEYTTDEVKVMIPTNRTYRQTVSICINEIMKRVNKSLPEKLMLLK